MPPASAAASGTRSITAKSPRQAPSSNRTGPGYAHVTSTSTSTPGSGRLGQGRRRHRKVLKDTIQAVTKGDIRRLARRGGVKRISAGIYNEARAAMKDFMIKILEDAIACVELRRAQTLNFADVIYALKRRGHTLYGFGPNIVAAKTSTNRSRHSDRAIRARASGRRAAGDVAEGEEYDEDEIESS